jgi:hypothetical protein
MILDYAQGEHAFILSKTGGGKSYLVEKEIKSTLKNNYVIFDIKGEDFNNLGAQVVKSYSELVKALAGGATKILYKDQYLNQSKLDKACQLLYKCFKNITIVIDEHHLLGNKHKIAPWVKQFLKVGRSSGRGCWIISQRGQDVHNDILTQCTHKLCGFCSTEDQDYLRKKMELDKVDFDFKDLEQYEFIYYIDRAGEIPKRVKA